MSKLKPCPFCGGEGDWYEVKPGYGYVSCDTCDATIGCFDALPKQDAIDAWNTRAERTCRNTEQPGEGFFTCSACNGSAVIEWTTGGWGKPNYCPTCGARVVYPRTER